MLDLALNNPFQSFGGKELYPSIQAKEARLCFGLVKNHAMLDGNKRLGCMGNGGVKPEPEDELCAEYIKSILEGKEFTDFEQKVKGLKNNGGKHFFDKSRQNFFPKADFYMCIEYNKFPFVITIEKDEIGYIARKYFES